ncbi:sulfurtransferase [Eudoraea chungangensis]|uniref:sulfurtransferase n=1 Tax=Eudoraea chungangensis TaxID=1481905 RepID=UPI0023ED29A7|nr:sulfurtransferase [Eudoraea chungangensis]
MHPLVSVNWLIKNLDNPKLVLLEAGIDVGSYYQKKGIKGRRYFDLKGRFQDPISLLPNTIPNPNDFEENARLLGINKDSIIVVYDTQGIYFSPRVWYLFRIMGHKEVAVLDGGLPEWLRQNLPLEEITKKSQSKGSFTANFQKDLLRSYAAIAENVTSKKELLIDARSEGRFKGTEEEPRKGLRSGNIPNSFNLPYTKVLQDGKYKSIKEIKPLFTKFESKGKPLVFTCGSGITACIIMLAAELVNNTPKSVFDGSWTEWASKKANGNL